MYASILFTSICRYGRGYTWTSRRINKIFYLVSWIINSLYILYVDDSGSPNPKDSSDYYVISGIIVHELDIRNLERNTQNYKDNFFKEYSNCEIHVHDIYKSQKEFSSLTLKRKYELLDSLYNFINTLPITVISIGIDKLEFIKKYPQPDIFSSAWTFLTERFDNYISDNGNNINKGIIIVDKSSKIPEKDICKVVNRLRKTGSYYQSIYHIVEEPIFIESDLREGIQIADACAYCTLKHLTGYDKFKPYWNIVSQKLRKGKNEVTEGYGFKIFP